MLAANIWHWWIGVALTGVGVLAAIGIGATYLKSISSQRFPPDDTGRRRARESEL